jgi:hypothetical protein
LCGWTPNQQQMFVCVVPPPFLTPHFI